MPVILCVDDDADDLLFITSALQQAHPAFTTVVARNGVEALAYLEEAVQSGCLPRLVIMDINMPRMDGRATLAAIRRDPRYAGLQVVLFSTSCAMTDKLFCARYGVELVTKPCTYDEVVRAVQAISARVLNSA